MKEKNEKLKRRKKCWLDMKEENEKLKRKKN
jgi:hypothetical protein